MKVRTSELGVSGQFSLTVGAYASTGFCATVKLRIQDNIRSWREMNMSGVMEVHTAHHRRCGKLKLFERELCKLDLP